MRLADYILLDMEAILAAWEAFAANLLPAAADMDSHALRDHAEQILQAVAEDLRSVQTPEQQVEKSKLLVPRPSGSARTAAETHALLRVQSGFDINQMASEYRALRASVLYLWAKACEASGINAQDIIRFNEAIDQALVESIAFFSAQVDDERNLLLGMLGHDMRNPLQVIQLTAKALSKLDAGADVAAAAVRLSKSSANIKALLDDLLDFNRTKLGVGLTIAPSTIDLAEIFTGELEQLRVAHPGRQIELEVSGDVSGVWDKYRLHQLLGNLIVNALTYGTVSSPVRVVLSGRPAEVIFAVHNQGPKIEPSTLSVIFNPLKRGVGHQDVSSAGGSLGLGLFIAREIALAHDGEIAATSNDTETVFTVRLPRLSVRVSPSST
jgi:signal transduction histidine kinase